MPIKPENKALYPADWPQIRARILNRARWRCEWCAMSTLQRSESQTYAAAIAPSLKLTPDFMAGLLQNG